MAIILSPNMMMPVPVVGIELGPTWAQDINSCLSITDQHNHSPGSGVQITQAGINLIPAATTFDTLGFNSGNAFGLRSVKFVNQSAPLALATDVGSIYESGSNLYFNNGAGVPVQITSGNSIVGTAGSISGLPSGTASASYAGGTFTFQEATLTSAAINVGPVSISQQIASAKTITIQSPNALAVSYSLTLPSGLPASSTFAFLTVDSVGNISDSVALPLTGANIAPVGQQISASSGVFSTTSTTPVPVTNLTVSITTGGKPVMLQLVSDGSGNGSYLSGSGEVFFYFFRGATQIANCNIDAGSNIQIPVSSFSHMDVIGAGPYTYTCQASVLSFGSPTATVAYAKLVAYELK